MTVNADGSFTMEQRTYVACSDSPPPCDTDVNAQITDGAYALGTLHAASGTVATGVISTTNDAPLMPTGPVTFTLNTTNDAINALNLNWCGPSAPSGICY